jgi:hypothetical protein
MRDERLRLLSEGSSTFREARYPPSWVVPRALAGASGSGPPRACAGSETQDVQRVVVVIRILTPAVPKPFLFWTVTRQIEPPCEELLAM